LVTIYLFFLFVSELFPVVAGFIFLNKKYDFHIQLLTAWFLVRFLTDTITYLLKINFELSVFPFYHVSILIEGVILIYFFVSINKNSTYIIKTLYLIPIIIFLMETLFFSSIFQTNNLSFIVYNCLISILLLTLLIKINKVDYYLLPIVKAFFVYHSVSFFYSLFETFFRINSELMAIVYPVFLLFILSLNLFYTFYLWSPRKN
jgi:hypothetical protein